MKDLTKISKFLSLVLRHSPQTIKIRLDENGWADVDKLIQQSNIHKMKFDFETLEEVVFTNDKQRFSFNDDYTKIRANQGHSVDVNLELEAVKPLPILYHGTVEKYLDNIKINGLQKMQRQHVHLSKDLETAIKVGNRRGKAIVLEINALEMYKDGFEFYLSKNGVCLSNEIPAKYIKF